MIETKHLILRPIQLTDVDDMFEYAKDKETGPRAGWPPHKNVEETRGLIEYWLSAESNEEQYALLHKIDNKMIGTMGIVHLNKYEKDDKNIIVKELIKSGKQAYEIGVTISRQYWGKGIATETLEAMLKYLFENRNADVVITCHYVENIGSKKVQEKNNMQILGSYECDKKWFNTDCTTMIVRGKTREEWLAEHSSDLTKE